MQLKLQQNIKIIKIVKVSSNFDPDYDNATRQPQTRTERVPVWF